MKTRVRAVVVQNSSLLLIRRIKSGEEYYVFPGGGVEEGETFEQALQREGREELGVDLRVKEVFAIQPVKKDGRDEQEIFYLCEVVGGVLGTGNGPEYKTSGSKGSYEPMWMTLNKLSLLRVLPESIKDKVLKEVSL